MLSSENNCDISELTQLAAGNAFLKSGAVMTMRDTLSLIFEAKVFAALFPNPGQPAESPERLVAVKGATVEPGSGLKKFVQRRIGKEQL